MDSYVGHTVLSTQCEISGLILRDNLNEISVPCLEIFLHRREQFSSYVVLMA